MDSYQAEMIISDLRSQLEELTYRVYAMEDSVANVNAYIEEIKGNKIKEREDA